MDLHHVQLAEDDGVARELVPARWIEGSEWIVSGTPGIVNGCAAGDRLDVQPDGTFVVVERGGNIAVHVYSRESLAEIDLIELRRRFATIDGALFEWPDSRRFAVATIPSTAGFGPIETIMGAFVDAHAGLEWYFGNVYNEHNQPLDWW